MCAPPHFPRKKIGLSVAARIHKSCLSCPPPYSNEFSSSPETFVFPHFGISKFENMLRFTLGKEIRKVCGGKRSGRPKMLDISALCDTEDLFDTLFSSCISSLLRSDYKRLTTHFPSFSTFVSGEQQRPKRKDESGYRNCVTQFHLTACEKVFI